MSHILFSHSYFLRFDKKQWEAQQPFPPLMTITAASLMRGGGHTVDLFDSMLAEGPHQVEAYLAEAQPSYFVVFDDGFNYLTKMCLTRMRHAAFDMAQRARQHGATVIVCSSDSTDHYDQYLQNGADYVILGEGEMTLKALIDNLNSAAPQPGDIAGLAFYENEQLRHTGGKEPLKQLDLLPMAAWDLIDMPAYQERWYQHHGYFALNVSTTRGCPFKCNWCAKPIYGNRYNSRSPALVADEIAYLIAHYSPDRLWITDDIFGLKPNWVQEFNEAIQARNLTIRYTIQSRADLLLKGDTTEALAASGCEEIWIGAESGSQKILDAMEKGAKVEQIYRACERVKANNMRMAFFLQFGYLGEEREDIDATIRMLLDCMPHDIGVSISYPLPGTKFYEKVKDDLQEKANWAESDDLAMMFRSTYSQAFYRELHRYVHRLYRSKQSGQELREGLQQPAKVSAQWVKQAARMPLYRLAAWYHSLQLKRLAKAA